MYKHTCIWEYVTSYSSYNCIVIVIIDNTYLDHAGATLYAASQVAAAAQQLERDVICNPHTCRSTSDYVDQVRYK